MQRIVLRILLAVLGLCLVGCGVLGIVAPPGTGGEGATPLVGEAEAVQAPAAPAPMLLQLREGGGLAAAPATDLPRWTLYEDGLLVWTQEGPPPPGFTRQVWTGRLTDEQIAALLTLAEEGGFWSLAASYGTSATIREVNGAPTLELAPLDLPASVITLSLPERQHTVLVYPADSPQMPEGYRALRERMLATRPAQPTRFTPVTLRLEARDLGAASTLRRTQRLAAWPFGDLPLASIATTPQVVTGALAARVRTFVARQGTHVTQGGQAYRLGVYAEPPRPLAP